MHKDKTLLLAVNAGSSSVKVVIYEPDAGMRVVQKGAIDGIGYTAILKTETADSATVLVRPVQASSHEEAITVLVDWIEAQVGLHTIAAIGHRIVHGGPKYTHAVLITKDVVEELRGLVNFDPLHVPIELTCIELMRIRVPEASQVACFDTSFYGQLPAVAQILPIPRRYEKMGIKRYGFHGLSYTFLQSAVEAMADANGSPERIVFAHLGSGASLTATVKGKPIDTSMSFTPTSGIPMSTRSGDLDPGIARYLHQTEGMSMTQFNEMVNKESGLLGISELSADMYTLLQHEQTNAQAADAIRVFCYQAKKTIGAFAAAMGGIDMLVFSGGIGEKAPLIRSRICEGLAFLGITLDETRNAALKDVISANDSRVPVLALHTDEELVIAQQTIGITAASTSDVKE